MLVGVGQNASSVLTNNTGGSAEESSKVVTKPAQQTYAQAAARPATSADVYSSSLDDDWCLHALHASSPMLLLLLSSNPNCGSLICIAVPAVHVSCPWLVVPMWRQPTWQLHALNPFRMQMTIH